MHLCFGDVRKAEKDYCDQGEYKGATNPFAEIHFSAPLHFVAQR
jgi:hypothetical protein